MIRFQSSPSPKAGRCQVGHVHPRPVGAVSILAQPEGWALHASIICRSTATGSFQSSPSPKAGRCLLGADVSPPDSMFQSSPSPKAGRCRSPRAGGVDPGAVSILAQPEGWALPLRALGLLGALDVSILAQPEGWALRRPPAPTPRCGTCFNPRPARRLGAARRAVHRGPGRRSVSILAQPEGWALQEPSPG